MAVLLCAIYLRETEYMNQGTAPQAVQKKIPNLLISPNDRGSQDHTFLLAAYKTFDKCLEEINMHAALY